MSELKRLKQERDNINQQIREIEETERDNKIESMRTEYTNNHYKFDGDVYPYGYIKIKSVYTEHQANGLVIQVDDINNIDSISIENDYVNISRLTLISKEEYDSVVNNCINFISMAK